MVVQAEALAAVTGDERADAIAALGRRTMGEMHRTLKVLRDEGGLAPQPGLDDLGDVIEHARGAGVPISFAVEGAPRALPPALDASAFRIVQEAVTNVIRHAGGAAASVTVHYGDDALELRVTDEGGRAGRRQRRPRARRHARAGRRLQRHARGGPARARLRVGGVPASGRSAPESATRALVTYAR